MIEPHLIGLSAVTRLTWTHDWKKIGGRAGLTFRGSRRSSIGVKEMRWLTEVSPASDMIGLSERCPKRLRYVGHKITPLQGDSLHDQKLLRLLCVYKLWLCEYLAIGLECVCEEQEDVWFVITKNPDSCLTKAEGECSRDTVRSYIVLA